MSTDREAHWAKSKRLMIITMIIWFIFSFVVHWFAGALNSMVPSFMGFPLGFYMAAQGSLVVFVVLMIRRTKKAAQLNVDMEAATRALKEYERSRRKKK